MLFRNFFREIAGTLPRLLSVIIIAALGVFMYVGMAGFTYNLQRIADDYYASQNVGDYWIYGSAFTKTDQKKLAALAGVKDIEARIALDAQPVRDKDITVNLVAVSGDFTINRPLLISGGLPKTAREAAFFDEYAQRHGLKIGDTCELKIKDTEFNVKLTVCGLVRSPEFIYNISGIEMMPDSYKLGFAYLKAEALEPLMGENICNQFCVTLEDGADEAYFKSELDRVLGSRILALSSFEDNKKASILMDGIKEMKASTTSFPTIFFLISALIMFTTMSRIIENARMQIGTLKAIGYSDLSVFLYYLAYAQIVVILGVLTGVLPAQILTAKLVEMYNSTLSLPFFTLRFSPKAVITSLLVTNIFCTGTAFYICLRELKEMPAECMRPKQQKNGRSNLLEKIDFLWRKMSFTAKAITRNIFRHKMRLVMCVAGVAGCMAIILTAFGMDNSNNYFFTMLFKKMHNYDLQVVLKDDISQAQYLRLQNVGGVEKCEYQMSQSAAVTHKNKKESSTITVTQDTVSLMLFDISADSSMTLPPDGVIVASVLAKKLDIKEGDTINVELIATHKTLSLQVSQILKNINGIYAGQSAWRRLGQAFTPNAAYIHSNDVALTKEKVSGYDFVVSAKQKSEIVEAIEVQLETMNTIVFLMILLGGVLAFVVLYNLGVMNYFERIRELATLMVLGFYDKEIKVLVLRENTIFTIIGIIAGLPLGGRLLSYLVSNSETAGFEVDAYISAPSFLAATVLTFSFSFFVNALLGKKFKTIDMIGALKSVE